MDCHIPTHPPNTGMTIPRAGGVTAWKKPAGLPTRYFEDHREMLVTQHSSLQVAHLSIGGNLSLSHRAQSRNAEVQPWLPQLLPAPSSLPPCETRCREVGDWGSAPQVQATGIKTGHLPTWERMSYLKPCWSSPVLPVHNHALMQKLTMKKLFSQKVVS